MSCARTRKRKTSERDRDSRKRKNPRNEVHYDPPEPSSEDEKERFFVIEKLLDRRINQSDGQEEFLVRWLNYTKDWDTWEPRAEVERNASDMVKNFNRQDRPCDNDLHCICHRPYKFDQGGMIQCFNCYTWFHFKCIEMNMEQANLCLRYYCTNCMKADGHLKILYKTPRAERFYSTRRN